MNKTQAVQIMTETIEKMNIELAKAQGIDELMMMSQITHMRPEIERVNGFIFDALNDNGYIVGLTPDAGW